MTARLRKLVGTIVFYPVTFVYLVGVAVAVAVAHGQVGLGMGLLILTGLTVAALLVATFREVRVVHYLVNSQRDLLLRRIADLIDTLNEAGVPLPEHEKVEGRRR